jgi:phage gpG-like protein
MPFQIKIEVFGDEIVSRKLLRFAAQAEDMSSAWDEVTDELKRGFNRNFQQQGPGWAPLKPGTVRQRIAQGYPPGPILTRSGRYKRAMTGGLQTIKTPGSLVAIAPSVPGAFHQHGTSKPMPARPLRLNQRERQNIVKIIQRSLIEGYTKG